MAESDGGHLTRDNLLLILILFTGIVGSGIARRLLGELGYNGVGRVVFVLGYGGMIFALWYGWIRPLDITGPSERERSEPERSER
ncbi:hypothetical protein [Haloprofundus halobius]|uniref:hypothetical protein n=1 Tax=Haloprofundus halobius TaxID=2876194 RepID=UPI001CCE48FD|nr:hypothetical protein [Haloprofundus halobius]